MEPDDVEAAAIRAAAEAEAMLAVILADKRLSPEAKLAKLKALSDPSTGTSMRCGPM